MNPDRRFIFDNNVLISAFLFKGGTPRRAFDLALSLGTIIHCSVSAVVTLCRDPKDDKFLSLALSADAESVTSGDKDLLVLSDVFSVPIYTPAQFIEVNSKI